MDFEYDDDPDRIDFEAAWAFLSTEAYWHRARTRSELRRQIDGAWRVVGCYRAGNGEMVGFCRALSDGVRLAYLADVYVLPSLRGGGLGRGLVAAMVDGGPGARFRWMLHTADAHGLYREFGFGLPDASSMERPAAIQ